MKSREFQQSRVYRAEGVLVKRQGDTHLKTVKDVEQWVTKHALKKPWFKRAFVIEGVVVHPGYGRRRACGCSIHRFAHLTLPKWSRQELVVLHELAHACTFQKPWHGLHFVGTYLFLVEKIMGKETADILRDSFRANKVDWTTTHLR